jgi:hypothetical protein
MRNWWIFLKVLVFVLVAFAALRSLPVYADKLADGSPSESITPSGIFSHCGLQLASFSRDADGPKLAIKDSWDAKRIVYVLYRDVGMSEPEMNSQDEVEHEIWRVSHRLSTLQNTIRFDRTNLLPQIEHTKLASALVALKHLLAVFRGVSAVH